MSSAEPLPVGLPIVLDRNARRSGRALVGGSPRRRLVLSPRGWGALEELQTGMATAASALLLGRRLVDAGIAHPRPPRGDARSQVTIVVPVRDRPAELERCLDALESDAATIVVDDGSRDPAGVAAIAGRHNARLVRRPLPGGPAAARNAALPLVGTEFVAFLDSDCIASAGWCEALIGHFDDPLIAAVAPRVRPAHVERGGCVARYLAARSPLDMGGRDGLVRPGGRVAYVPAAALLARAGALGECFDEDLRYGEDVDLIWRLHDVGWCVRYDPSVSVEHQEPETVRHLLARRFRYGTSAAPLVRRHPSKLAPAVLAPVPMLVILLAYARRPRSATLLAVAHAATLAWRARRIGLPLWNGARWEGEACALTLLSLSRYLATFALAPAVVYGHRRRRPGVLALLVVAAVHDWWRREAQLALVGFIALALADDAAYGAGVYWGAIRAGTLRPLIPVPASRPAG